MKLFKLTPIDGKFAGWKCSAYRGSVIVRAQNEAQARMLVTRSFVVTVRLNSIATNPWGQKSVVKVTETKDRRFQKAEMAQILAPLAY